MAPPVFIHSSRIILKNETWILLDVKKQVLQPLEAERWHKTAKPLNFGISQQRCCKCPSVTFDSQAGAQSAAWTGPTMGDPWAQTLIGDMLSDLPWLWWEGGSYLGQIQRLQLSAAFRPHALGWIPDQLKLGGLGVDLSPLSREVKFSIWSMQRESQLGNQEFKFLALQLTLVVLVSSLATQPLGRDCFPLYIFTTHTTLKHTEPRELTVS